MKGLPLFPANNMGSLLIFPQTVVGAGFRKVWVIL